MATTACRECGDPLDESEVDPEAHRYRCSHCGAVQPWRPSGEELTFTPSDLQLEIEEAGERVIMQPWTSPQQSTGIVFGFTVLGGMWVTLALAFFPSGFKALAIGASAVFLPWVAAQQLLNATRVRFGRTAVSVEHGPVPSLRRNVRLPWGTIAGFRPHMDYRFSQSRDADGRPTGRQRATVNHQVMVRTKSGGEQRLVVRLPSRDDAKYLCQELNAHLERR